MNVEEIMKIIPHRYPMLLLDEVDELQVMEYAHGYKAVSYNEAFFQGHFPDKPVLPGVFIIESLSQLCNVMILSHEDYKGKITYYTKMAKVKFFDAVKPGSIIELKVKKKGQDENMVVCTTEAYVKDKLVFSGEMSLMIIN